MELFQVRYFLALAKTFNFTRAAEACNVTQPALTRAIQRLEEELGGPLLYRERTLTQLTELGRVMLPHLEAAYLAAQTATAQAAAFKRREAAPLRLGLCWCRCCARSARRRRRQLIAIDGDARTQGRVSPG